MTHVIITGATRGIGYHLAGQLADSQVTLHLVARSPMERLGAELEEKGATACLHPADLSRTDNIPGLVDRVFGAFDPERARSVTLINNAGTLRPIGPIGRHDISSYRANLELNFMAPALLSHAFVQRLAPFECEKRLIFISSGAAVRPYVGWSHYCSTKAGIDMLMRCIALEQAGLDDPVRVMGYSPGRTETAMQREIRSQAPEDFPAVDSFLRAQEEDRLNDPREVATHIATFVHSADFPTGEIVDFRAG